MRKDPTLSNHGRVLACLVTDELGGLLLRDHFINSTVNPLSYVTFDSFLYGFKFYKSTVKS